MTTSTDEAHHVIEQLGGNVKTALFCDTSATKACYLSHLNYTSVSKEAKHVER